MKRVPAPAFRPAVLAAVLALIGAQALFVAGYVSHERTIYFWDHAMYIGMARQAFATFVESFTTGWAMFRNSLADNYNLIFAVPSFVTFSLFGSSRLVFIETNFFVFFLAYEIAVAFLLRRSLNIRWGAALIISLVASSFIPPLWLPLLEGYPDSGAAACIVFAAALGWGGSAQPRMIRRALSVGLVLGCAVLLRRHFVYAAIALLVTFAFIEFWDILRARSGRRQKMGRAAVYFSLCGLGLAATLAVVAPEFLQSSLTINYGKLYISYQRPAGVFLRFVLGGFGFGLLLLAADGLFFLSRLNSAGRKLAVFAALYVFLWLVVWCLGPDQMGHHYILHAVPLFVTLGLAGWSLHLSGQRALKKYLYGGVMLLGLAANSAWALWLSPVGVWPNDNGSPGLLSAARPPVVRPDYDEWRRLAGYLQRTTTADDRIMMVGSSFVFNLDLLHSVYMDMPGGADMAPRFPKNPEIDHEEPAPFDIFAGSDVYVVPEPPQYHLDPEGQRVITAAANQFPPPPARAGMFHADEDIFHLADNVTVKIWRRTAWTPGALHGALAEIRRDGPQDPNFAQGWAATVLPLHTQIVTDARNYTAVEAFLDPQHRDLRLFFDYPLGQSRQRVVLSSAGNCADPRLRLTVLTASGHAEATKDFAPAETGGAVSWVFTISASGGSRFLQLDLSTAPASLCRVELRELRVERMP